MNSTLRQRLVTPVCLLLYASATLQFARFYSKSTTFYLNMPAYLNGHERLPFQERVLPILFLRPLANSPWVARHLAHDNGVFTLERGPFYLLSLIALLVAAIFCQKLYNLLSADRALSLLVFPLFLLAVMWTFSIHSEANFSYPYDLPSLAFFTAGLYYIYSRRYLGVFLVILLGTFNRETTLFLIGIYLLDCASRNHSGDAGYEDDGKPAPSFLKRFNLRAVPWVRVVLLVAVWVAIKEALAHHFAHNDSSEDFLRIHNNLRQLSPRLLPALLNICGYSVPLVVLFFKDLRPVRFANYTFILVPWFAVMFCAGVIVETRIYGELCAFAAVSLVLIMEHRTRAAALRRLAPPSSAEQGAVLRDTIAA